MQLFRKKNNLLFTKNKTSKDFFKNKGTLRSKNKNAEKNEDMLLRSESADIKPWADN